MIIENERDRRAVEWLEARFSAEAIAEAEKSLAGARKPFVSNIARVLGVTLPDELKIASAEEAAAHIAKIQEILNKRR